MTRRRAVFALVLACGASAGGAARAQDREADAERLFREGQKLLEQRRYGEACPKLEAAYKKDGQLGTLLNLAFCHKEQGANWYAWLEFRAAELMAIERHADDRRAFARKELDDLERGLPKVVVPNPHGVPLTAVLVEDRRVPEAERGAVFAAEPGARKMTFRAKGKKPATVLVKVAKSDHLQRIAVPPMEDLGPEDLPPPPAPAPAPVAATPPPPPKEEPAPPPAEERGGTQRLLGYGALGLAGAGVVVGGVTGVMTLTNPCATLLKSKGSACDEDPDQEKRADTTGLVSTVAFAAGGAFAVTGLVLLVTAPSRKEARVAPAVGAGWAGVRGVF